MRTSLIRLLLHSRKSIMVKHTQNDDAITLKYLTSSDFLVFSVGKEDYTAKLKSYAIGFSKQALQNILFFCRSKDILF